MSPAERSRAQSDRKYNLSAKGHKRHTRYNQSVKGKIRRARWMKAHKKMFRKYQRGKLQNGLPGRMAYYIAKLYEEGRIVTISQMEVDRRLYRG